MKVGISTLKRSALYSEELSIDLRRAADEELFKWFLASILFGTRITETIAKNTYRSFERHHLLDPRKIIEAGWDFLVNPVMREGGYVRYDEKTSTKILRICQTLFAEYGGSLKTLHKRSSDSDDLETRVMQFYGVGPVTMNIFLRELRPFWKKSNPEPLPVVKKLARRYGINLNKYKRKSLTFVRIEAGLIRLRKTGKNPSMP
ncbi:MAG: hypothetical protein NT096_09740 [Proteobacteria bacterium]|nr:hypothetical protein [Pseudomonadota bacterium]